MIFPAINPPMKLVDFRSKKTLRKVGGDAAHQQLGNTAVWHLRKTHGNTHVNPQFSMENDLEMVSVPYLCSFDGHIIHNWMIFGSIDIS